MIYAEVILPLPIYSTFTYSVPTEMESLLSVGSRVLVQFGRKKFYTAVVAAVRPYPPADYEVKPITAVLDPTPIVRFPQMKLWEWVAEYYLCAPGEVMKAALPAGLKPESETVIALVPDFEAPEGMKLTERMEGVITQLQIGKKLRISDLESALGISNLTPTVSAMMELGIIELHERVQERYRPKKVTIVEPTFERGDNDALHKAMDAVSRSVKQQNALLAFLDLSGWMTRGADTRTVEKETLLKKADISSAILKSMADKGIFNIVRKSINRFTSTGAAHGEIILPQLSPAQSDTEKSLIDIFKTKDVVLLRGVTGSGKTEIYSHLMRHVLEQGKQVLFLVPEISLTTQLTDRLRRMFGDRLLVYHSKFSDNERTDIYRRLLSTNEPLIILGARSAVFLPFAQLGLVIVDEEHESSYKQYDPAPRYNARDTATVLASMHGAKTLLGSATPSIETYYKAQEGKYGLVELTERFSGARLPNVEIVDMREQRKQKLNSGILSKNLKLATDKTLASGNQAIMFQNRRGFAPIVVCQVCGWTPKCRNCDVSLVYHKNTQMLRCHYCGYAEMLPKVCPACEENRIGVFGYGTERIAEEIQERFPQARVARMDLDTTRNKDAYQEIIEKFARKDTDILVGTQMVSKGLDFEHVKTVGIISADTLLNFPDFRSNERAFNMMEQVAGRAGRKGEAGTVFIQTSQAENPVLDYVRRHDYTGFYEAELESRRRLGYPPFTRVINVYLRNKDSRMCDDAARLLANTLRQSLGNRILGPEKPFVARVSNQFIQSIMIKIETGASMSKIKEFLRRIYESLADNPAIKTSTIYYDVDPA
ncbi:MAG: primosomal protein N' [Bacteroides sp.]|nr:primosomal protein N' [Bacteroides sp.]